MLICFIDDLHLIFIIIIFFIESKFLKTKVGFHSKLVLENDFLTVF